MGIIENKMIYKLEKWRIREHVPKNWKEKNKNSFEVHVLTFSLFFSIIYMKGEIWI